MAEVYGLLTVEGERGDTITEIRDYFLCLEDAYNNLYTFELIFDRARQLAYGEGEPGRYRPGVRVMGAIKPFKNVQGLVLLEDRLRLVSVII